MRRYLQKTWLPLIILGLSIGLPLPSGGHILGIPSICPFQNITGIPCPGCGLTRSFVCLGHGRFKEAFFYHPAGPVLFTAMLIYLLLSLPAFSLEKVRLYSPHLGVACLSLLLMIWSVRLAGLFPWP